MLIVRVELHSAITGKATELARMYICNDNTGDFNSRNYNGIALRGRDKETLDKETVQKQARLLNFKSEQFHVWNLVRAMLTNLGYTKGQ